MTATLLRDDEYDGDVEDVATEVEGLISDFCAEQGTDTFEARIEGLSGYSKADGQPLLQINREHQTPQRSHPLSTYWYLGCPACKEYSDAASQQGSGANPLGDENLTLRHFIVHHAPCRSLEVIGEWDERLCEWLEWNAGNAKELYDRESPKRNT